MNKRWKSNFANNTLFKYFARREDYNGWKVLIGLETFSRVYHSCKGYIAWKYFVSLNPFHNRITMKFYFILFSFIHQVESSWNSISSKEVLKYYLVIPFPYGCLQ